MDWIGHELQIRTCLGYSVNINEAVIFAWNAVKINKRQSKGLEPPADDSLYF